MGRNMTKTDFNQSSNYEFALTWGDVGERSYRQEILDLANKIGRVKQGSSRECIPFGPEYALLEVALDEYQANVALHLKFREKMSAQDVADASGEPLQQVTDALEHIAWAGVAFVNCVDGVDRYWQDTYVPGHMEMVVNNKELVAQYPQIGDAFYYYGKKRGPAAAGIMPIGGGPMRVIPIERAIEDNTQHLSYEEVSQHLNEATVFSVSDCSCRTSREEMGEGCGHLKEEMCIQLDHAAEYYIRTGRAREITREEAMDIIRKAEDNGLMHSIPNLDGPGHTHAICNCCGCGCYAMRLANEFVNGDIVRSNYQAVVDEEKCVACGECVESCPTNALRLGQKLCTQQPIDETITTETPRDQEWTADKMNPDYRTNRKNTLDSGTAPCITKCPAHIPVQGYIKLAAQGKYSEALELIKKHNPLPAVCGRVCPRLCEEDCTRDAVDEAVAVDDIKKFIAQQDLDSEHRYMPRIRHDYSDKKIAVIGSGPSGLTCAYDLALDGYAVTVFEKEARLGGMLTLGIPSYRLEKDVIEAEIDVIRRMGVEFRTGVNVGRDVTIQQLRDQGYDAFYIAIGAQSGRKLQLDGEDAAEVISGVDFLRDVNLGNETPVAGKAVVIGGGNVAIDVARSATRLDDVQAVSMVCLESRDAMPAHGDEVAEALAEDIAILNGWGPSQILLDDGRVSGVEFKRCLSVLDADGRFNPQYDEADTQIVPCDYVLLSVGQTYRYDNLLQGEAVALTPRQTIQVDPVTLQSTQADIFAGGDVASGPHLAIDAIAAGKEAAVSIHRFVQKGQSLVFGRDNHDYVMLDKDNVDYTTGYDVIARQRTPHVDGAVAKTTFNDLRGILTEEQIQQETQRCLGCGATKVDGYLCVGCGQCTLKCKFDAIHLERVHDEAGYEIDDLKKAVIKQMVKRKVKITANKLNPFKKAK